MCSCHFGNVFLSSLSSEVAAGLLHRLFKTRTPKETPVGLQLPGVGMTHVILVGIIPGREVIAPTGRGVWVGPEITPLRSFHVLSNSDGPRVHN